MTVKNWIEIEYGAWRLDGNVSSWEAQGMTSLDPSAVTAVEDIQKIRPEIEGSNVHCGPRIITTRLRRRDVIALIQSALP